MFHLSFCYKEECPGCRAYEVTTSIGSDPQQSPSPLKTEEKGFPVLLKFEFFNPDYDTIKGELVQGKVTQKGLTR
jgi:hypothetical protein